MQMAYSRLVGRLARSPSHCALLQQAYSEAGLDVPADADTGVQVTTTGYYDVRAYRVGSGAWEQAHWGWCSCNHLPHLHLQRRCWPRLLRAL